MTQNDVPTNECPPLTHAEIDREVNGYLEYLAGLDAEASEPSAWWECEIGGPERN